MAKAAVINDLSGFGRCSLGVAIPILSVCGIQSCAVPTAVLTNQTGFPDYSCIDLTEYLDNYIKMWNLCKADFDGIYSGYIAHPKQADFIGSFIDNFKKEDTLVLVDPVMGDNGEIYKGYSDIMCDKMRSLTMKADVITPNLTELCLLSNGSYSDVCSLSSDKKKDEIKKMAQKLTDRKNDLTVIVTGIDDGNSICNMAFTKNSEYATVSERLGKSFSGTGDIFASVFTGACSLGMNIQQCLDISVKYTLDCIEATIPHLKEMWYGSCFELCLGKLIEYVKK